MKKLLLILVLFPIGVEAQQVSVSPTSVAFWGQAKETVRVGVQYKDFEAVMLKATQTYYDGELECNLQTGCTMGEYSGYFFGVFYKPIEYEYNRFSIEGGVGLFNRKFPTENGERINFTLQLSYQISDMIGISYDHVSNGFGLMNRLNPGIDNISLTINFN